MKSVAKITLLGFILLAVFGFITINESQSLISCLASSAGLVCDNVYSELSFTNHSVGAFEAITSVALVSFFVFALAMFLTTRLKSVNRSNGSVPAIAINNQSPKKISLASVIAWLSLFELSPSK